ncbi:hypothetical protein AOY38_11115 [Synechocystis sp. PCC 6803]|nr:hypothetical protein AOY38_11115 [Synechocystis sp. PCC 6803]AVP90175.1 hypothetical protein C7I86_11160 [Synechocystis sp. IPPAS B-1465]MCW5241288.1 hypothetical protein [Synechocystis sp. PCC 6803]
MFEKPPWPPKFGGKLSQSPPVLGDLGGRIRLYKQVLSTRSPIVFVKGTGLASPPNLLEIWRVDGGKYKTCNGSLGRQSYPWEGIKPIGG